MMFLTKCRDTSTDLLHYKLGNTSGPSTKSVTSIQSSLFSKICLFLTFFPYPKVQNSKHHKNSKIRDVITIFLAMIQLIVLNYS